jgi:hypothetical protein
VVFAIARRYSNRYSKTFATGSATSMRGDRGTMSPDKSRDDS